MRSWNPGLGAVACGLFLLVSAAPAAAVNMLSLEVQDRTARPDGSYVVPVGETLEVALLMHFDETTLGGGIVFDFDSAVLAFQPADDFSFDDGLGDDPDFRCPTDPDAPSPVACPSTDNFVSWGTFSGLSGDKAVGTAIFTAIGPGETDIALSIERPFSSSIGQSLEVSLPEPIMVLTPEPGTAALFAAGLLVVGGCARSRRS